ncbi:hypothetical protein BS50DRAFT_180131 [Corynespora cassiicola Philippines]|uniref:Uncharacterized protein n=1 Tax=Corynespora cassiicola Philippines TaxID=1448308 RepID=A0A2T2P674_CORCC|nr:hypothetical protein BS50DRAFT_180131 [Corynespora cassiicola Philippines]
MATRSRLDSPAHHEADTAEDLVRIGDELVTPGIDDLDKPPPTKRLCPGSKFCPTRYSMSVMPTAIDHWEALAYGASTPAPTQASDRSSISPRWISDSTRSPHDLFLKQITGSQAIDDAPRNPQPTSSALLIRQTGARTNTDMTGSRYALNLSPSSLREVDSELYRAASLLPVLSHADLEAIESFENLRAKKSEMQDNSLVASPPLNLAPEDTPSFPQMKKLPGEIRRKIYGFVLSTGALIRPRLNDRPHGNLIKFYDGNESGHDAIRNLSNLTLVSKQVCEESLPVFYNENTFACDDDTLTYFEHLSHTGRFHMLRNVSFVVQLSSDKQQAVRTVRLIHQAKTEARKYEEAITMNAWDRLEMLHENNRYSYEPPPPTQRWTPRPSFAEIAVNSPWILQNHPLYVAGGLSCLCSFLALQKLATPNADPDSAYTHEIAIMVPHARIFSDYPRLSWFTAAAESLGIRLRFVEGKRAVYSRGGVRLEWRQRYQKKDFGADEVAAAAVGALAITEEQENEKIQQALEKLTPEWRTGIMPRKVLYYRTHSRGLADEKMVWYQIDTENGKFERQGK